MKLKKLLSFVTAAAISASCFAGWTFTASAESSTAEADWVVINETVTIDVDGEDYVNVTPNDTLTYYGAEGKKYLAVKSNNRGHEGVKIKNNGSYVAIKVKGAAEIKANLYISSADRTAYIASVGSFESESAPENPYASVTATSGTSAYTLEYNKEDESEQTYYFVATGDAYVQTITVTMADATETTEEPTAEPTLEKITAEENAPYTFIAQDHISSDQDSIPKGTILDSHVQIAGDADNNKVLHDRKVEINGVTKNTAILLKGSTCSLHFKVAQASTITVYGNSSGNRSYAAGTKPGAFDLGLGKGGSGVAAFNVPADTDVYLTAIDISTVDSEKGTANGADLYIAGFKVEKIALITETVYDVATDYATNWSASADGISMDLTDNILTNTNTAAGVRSSTRTLNPAANQGIVTADFSIQMTTYNVGKITGNGMTDVYSYFYLQDQSGNNLVSIQAGSSADSVYSVKVNETDITDIAKATSNNSLNTTDTLHFHVTLDTATSELGIVVTNSESGTQTITSTSGVNSIAKIVSSLHRDVAETVISNLTITHQVPNTPIITVPNDTVTVEVGKSAVIAMIDTIRGAVIDVTQASTSNQISAKYNSTYGTVIATSSVSNAEETFTITAEIGDAVVETETVKVSTRPAEMATMQPIDTDVFTAVNESLVNITFDSENDTPYAYFDEKGSTHDESPTETSVPDYTSIEDTTMGLLHVTDKNTLATEYKDADSHPNIENKALYSYIVPRKEGISDKEPESQRANGYRGSFLRLDNAAVQRTDKIRVEYDFAFYNVVNKDYNADTETIGTPFSIAMTSEAEIEAGGIPYDFNGNHYDEIDSDPSNITTASKHLLTLFTGRPKRDGNGIHWVDMTNKLAYYEPLSGNYTDLGLTLTPNKYNYFHVNAEVDFYNNVITFTVTNNTNNASQTITTTIPDNSSWNGFIMSSNKWDSTQSETDINGQDTEHYSYLDNITAVRIGEQQTNLNPTAAPSLKPLPADAVSIVKSDEGATWAVKDAYIPYDENELQTIKVENQKDHRTFTNNIASGSESNSNSLKYLRDDNDDKGVTTYTEFDFMLPKEGSKLVLYLNGNKGDGDVVGNMLSISTAGVNSWTGLENYTLVTSERLESGTWYHMQIIHDQYGGTMLIKVTESATDQDKGSALVGTRNFSDGYYRRFAWNPNEVTTGSDDKGTALPLKQPSFTESYIANMRIYNRAVVCEYYPENVTILNSAASADTSNNNEELCAVVEYVKNTVSTNIDTKATRYTTAAGQKYPPIAPKSSNGKTWNGEWELIYSNGDGAVSGTDGIYTEGSNATRLKYRPVYVDLPVEEAKFPEQDGYYYKTFYTNLPIMTDNYKTIDWFVFNGENNAFRMKGSFDLTGIHDKLAGDGSYRIGYVVYNIPTEETIVNAVPQAHHEAADNITEFDAQDQTPPSERPTAMPLPSDAPATPTATAKPAEPAQID